MTDAGTHPTVALVRLAPGEVIAERYELRAPLGHGGMGVVWRVLDRELDEEVALKMLSPEHASTEEAHVRFRREVKLARRITHPNVARTYDLGRHQGLRFFTMELISGESLGSRMRSPLPLPETLRVTAEVCRGLAAAHAQGVVHRDLKPDNVMLSGERVVITDFGIARSEGDALATSGAIVGTPAYMAPEQLDARGIDGRADVYALGVVLFELVTGALPFHGDTPFAMAAARLAGPPPDPRTIRATVPDGVALLVLDMLALRREERPDAQTSVERIDVLRGAGAGPRPPTPAGLASLDLGTRISEGRTVRVDPLDAPPDATALAGDLAQAIRDALAGERGIQVVTAGGELAMVGELRLASGRARARLRLITSSGATAWASRVEAAADDPFGLEDLVVADVRNAVRLRAGGRRGPADPSVRERWAKAGELLSALDPRATREGIAALEELEREVPGEPSVQSLLAMGLVHLWLQTGGVDMGLAARAEELALRALDADASLAEAYLAVARVRFILGDHRAALRALREALARAPAYPEPHMLLGMTLADTGHVEEGLRRADVAVRLGSPREGSTLAMTLRVRALAGQETEVRAAIATARSSGRILSLIPLMTELSAWWSDRALAGETAELMAAAKSGGAWEAAIPLLRQLAAGEDYAPAARLAFADEARATPWHRALMAKIGAAYFAHLGMTEDVFRCIAVAAAQAPCLDLLWFDRMPLLAPLRDDPRFAAARAVVAARVAELGL